MEEGEPSKQYGLILPKKLQPVVAPPLKKKPAAFADSDSEDDSPGDWMQKTLQKETYGGGYRSKQSKAEIQRILNEDATVYQYDEVYDDIQEKRKEVADAKKAERVERKPRYIQHLLAAADKRKKENERRTNRQVQKEREAEGDEFADKEVFVTASYKKKLEEMKAAEEEEKRQERLEAIGDVTRQGDLSGFYRHLYEKVVLDVEDETEVPVPSQQKSNRREKQLAKSRQYRKRKSSESADEEADDASAAKKPPEPITLNESEAKPAVSESTENGDTDPSHLSEPTASNKAETLDADADADSQSDSETEKSVKREPGEEEKAEEEVEKEEEPVPEEPPKPKRSIWEKRTVGDIFDEALRRYYERKASRSIAVG